MIYQIHHKLPRVKTFLLYGIQNATIRNRTRKAKTRKQDDTNSRVQSSYDVYMYPQRANIPLQGLDRCALTVGAISGPHCQIEGLHWYHFTSCGFTWLAEGTLKK